jgi:hypothetical protein
MSILGRTCSAVTLPLYGTYPVRYAGRRSSCRRPSTAGFSADDKISISEDDRVIKSKTFGGNPRGSVLSS